MINFQSPAFPDLNNFCNKHLHKKLLSQAELYIAMALETQERLTRLLKTTFFYCTHKFYSQWSVSHSSLAIFQLHVNIYLF